MSDSMIVFNRQDLRRHRDRAADGLDAHDFLFRETAARLADRLDDVTREFPLALDLGCHGGELGDAVRGHGGIKTLIQSDLSPAMAARAHTTGMGPAMAADEEALPFATATFDLVMSNLSLHWINDLPGALTQVRQVLKPDGLFLASMLGGETLKELRRALTEAESEVEGGLSPRVSPMADVRDLGALLQRAGFALPVVDSETLSVSYGDPLKLLSDLRGMGESNVVEARRRQPMRRATLFRALEIYAETFGGPDGRVPATFQVITLTAWAPDPSQQQPLRPGSASARLSDALGAEELSAGEKANPGRRGPKE